MMRCGSCTVAQLVAVLGVAGLGVGGYTYFSGDCGSCSDATNTTLVATDECSGCCSGESKTAILASQTEGSCCEGATDGAAVTTVAHTEDASGCCTGEAKTACKNGTDGCTGDGTDGCCGGCTEEKKTEEAEKVASSGAPAGGGK